MSSLSHFENAAHVLDELIAWHEHLSELYDRLRHSGSSLSTLFLEQLSQHEKQQAEALERYADNAPSRVLKAPLRAPRSQDLDAFLGKLEHTLSPNADTLEIYQMASSADRFIGELLDQLCAECPSQEPEVQELFQDLVKGQHQKQIILSKAYNSLREM